MDNFSKSDLISAVENVAALMAQNKEYLIELDSVIGDGDLGLTMTKGFAAAQEAAQTLPDEDIGMMMRKIGMAISKAVPSTMGTLMATAFMGAGKSLTGNTQLDSKLLATMLQSMADAVSERGKAKEGDKTLLDVLYPASRAAKEYTGNDIAGMLECALQAAKEGLENTKQMMNQHGKAAVFREKSLGIQDPGATAACFLIEGFLQAAQAK